jgi:hypothetical protein
MDFDIIKNISKNYCRSEFYPELSSDNFSVIITVNSKIMIKFRILYNAKMVLQELLIITLDNSTFLKTDDNIISAFENFNHTIQQITWNADGSRYQYEILICNKRQTNRKKEAL